MACERITPWCAVAWPTPSDNAERRWPLPKPWCGVRQGAYLAAALNLACINLDVREKSQEAL
jgi:hypothetical protein